MLEDKAGNPASGIAVYIDERLILAPDELAQRKVFLGKVTVNDQGIAHCINSLNSLGRIDTALAAVRIDDNKDASLVPFDQAEDGALQLTFPAENMISRIGFFIGASRHNLMATLRLGTYPGEPLTVEVSRNKKAREIPYGLKGLSKGSEKDEIRWAEQIGLKDLGFKKIRTRGIFNKSEKPQRSNHWKDSPLLVVQEDLEDFILHPDPDKIKLDEYQLLVYSAMLSTNLRARTRGAGTGWYTNTENLYNPFPNGSIPVLEGAFRIALASQPSK